VLPLGAVGYSDINAEREPLLGVDKAAYEKFVSLIMKVIAMRVKEQLTHFGTNVGFVFAGTDGGVDRGLYDAARSLECPILGVVAQKYLHYAVDEDVDIVFTPDASDYPKKFMNLLTGGAVLPIGGATHSFGQDLFRWLSQDGEVLMIINTLLELFTNQVSPAIYNGAVLNAPRVFTTCCHLVGENVPFQKLSAALVVETNGALWKLNPPHELEALSIHLASAASVKV
jgi:hypothetical protein